MFSVHFVRKNVKNIIKRVINMKEIEEIYKNIILNGYYDERYGNKPEVIEGKMHGVCIDFSRELIKQLRENGYLAGLISTLNEDGYLHAATIYKNIESGEISIADPVADVRKLTGLTDEERTQIIEELLKSENWKRELRGYIKEFGIVTAYNDDLSKSMEDIRDKEELEAIPAINETISKKYEPIQTITSLEHVKAVADGPTLLACQSLYKKGISTFCSNYTPNGDVFININYNSLSDDNKKIIQRLKEENPESFYFKVQTGFYGGLGFDEEIDENKEMEVVLGIKDCTGKTIPEINLEMNQLITRLKKQEYLQDSYTREQMIAGKHLLNTTDAFLGNDIKSKANSKDTNEQIAKKEGFIYSAKYDRFFMNMATKSRYIESLCKEEHELRTDEEVAQDNCIFYDPKLQMFFENANEMQLYNMRNSKQQDYVKPSDIVEADMDRKIPHSKIQSIKIFFQNMLNKIREKGER